MSATVHKPEHDRRIRSFVRREGRLSPAQANALDEQWERFGIDPSAAPLDPNELFGREAPVVCEIGFGNGDNLLAACLREPERNFIGVEVHRPGVGRLLRLAAEAGVENLRVSTADAIDLLTQQIPPTSLAALWLYFPDPWHKKRHHKRRIVNTEFCDLLASRLVPGGEFQLATDWAEYAEWMRDCVNAHPAFVNQAAEGDFISTPSNRTETRFERRGLKREHQIFDLLYRRI